MQQNFLKDNSQTKQSYNLHCDCGFNKITDGTDFKLTEIKQTPVPSGIPTLVNGKIVIPTTNPRAKKFKCPKCGRGITARKSHVKIIPHLTEEKNDEESESTGRKTSTFGRAISPDFTG